MFQKPYRVKTNTKLKSSDRKKFISSLRQKFSLSDVQLDVLFHSKPDIYQLKAILYTNENVLIHTSDGVPIVFEVANVTYPTVYTLWRLPDMLHTFHTPPDVLHFLKNGADLMLPGIVTDEPQGFQQYGSFPKGHVCAIVPTNNGAPVAVGHARLSSEDMYLAGGAGKAVIVTHVYGDELWRGGPQTHPPTIDLFAVATRAAAAASGGDSAQPGDEERHSSPTSAAAAACCPPTTTDGDSDCEDAAPMEAISSKLHDDTDKTMAHAMDELRCSGASDDSEEASDDEAEDADNDECEEHGAAGDDDGRRSDSDDQEEEEDGEDEQEEEEAIDDDALLLACFLHAVKYDLPKTDLPILTSTFYRNRMMPYCPLGRTLNIKRTKYKKVGTFLASQAASGLITLSTTGTDVQHITAVAAGHPLLCSGGALQPALQRQLQPAAAAAQTAAAAKSGAPRVEEVLIVTQPVVTIFSAAHVQKGDSISPADARRHIDAYIRAQRLQMPTDPRLVQLDRPLAALLGGGGGGSRKSGTDGGGGGGKGRVHFAADFPPLPTKSAPSTAAVGDSSSRQEESAVGGCVGKSAGVELTGETRPFKDVVAGVVAKMTRGYRISVPRGFGVSGIPQPEWVDVGKGNVPHVGLSVETKASNKKVTTVTNVTHYGIDLEKFCAEVKKGLSVGVTPLGTSALQVQGDQRVFVQKLLTGKYMIPTRFVEGTVVEKKKKKGK